MAQSVQEEPTEHLQSAAIEQAIAALHLMNGVEAKIAVGNPLNREEINHLYQFDEPIYKRTRDVWPYDLYSDDAPDLTARLKRYWAAQQSARESTLETLRVEYGDDADWLLENYERISPRIQELLDAGATPRLLAEQLSPPDQLRYFESLRSAGAPLDARDIYEAFATYNDGRYLYGEDVDTFIAHHAEELVDVDGISWRLAGAVLSHANEEGREAAIERLLSLGTDHWDILRELRAEEVEAYFQWLVVAGFTHQELLRCTSLAFALDNFDELFQQAPEVMSSLSFDKASTEDRTRYIIVLHRNGQSVKELLVTMNQGMHYSYTPQYEQFIAAGIDIHDIVDTFPGEDRSLIHLYAPWLIQHGADPEAIKAKYSPEGIVSVFETLRKAGIDINLQEYVDKLPASVIISRHIVLEKEEGLEIDYTAQLDAYEYQLDIRAARVFIDAGVDPKKVFEKLPVGSIQNDYFIDLFVEAGISREDVWQKVDTSMQYAAHLQALTDKDSTDQAFEAALQALPLDKVVSVLDDILSRTTCINAIVDKLATEKRVDHRAKELIEKGADPNCVVRGVSKGFWGMYSDADWLLDNGVDALLLYGHIKEGYIGVKLLVRLIEGGVPVQDILQTLDGSYFASNFDELTALGFDSTLLMKKIMASDPGSRFILKNSKLLNGAGYSADQLSAHLSAREVDEHVRELLLLGLSPTIALVHCMQVHGVSQDAAEKIIAQRLGIEY